MDLRRKTPEGRRWVNRKRRANYADNPEPDRARVRLAYYAARGIPPEAIPPNQKYNATSHDHTDGCMTGPRTGWCPYR